MTGSNFLRRWVDGSNPSSWCGYFFAFTGMIVSGLPTSFTHAGHFYAALGYFGCSVFCSGATFTVVSQRIATAEQFMMPHLMRHAIEGFFVFAALQAMPGIVMAVSHQSAFEGAVSLALQSCFMMSALVLAPKTGGGERAWIGLSLSATLVFPVYMLAMSMACSVAFAWFLVVTNMGLSCALIWFCRSAFISRNALPSSASARYRIVAQILGRSLLSGASVASSGRNVLSTAGSVFGSVRSTYLYLTPSQALRCIITKDFVDEAGWRSVVRGLWRRTPLVFGSVLMFIVLEKAIFHDQYPNTLMIALNIFNTSTADLLATISLLFRTEAAAREFASLLPGLGQGTAAKTAMLKAALYPTMQAAVLDLICVNSLLLLVSILYSGAQSSRIWIDVLTYNAACLALPGARTHMIVRIMSGLPEFRVLFVSAYIAFALSAGLALALAFYGYDIAASILATIAVMIAAGLLASFLRDWRSFQERPHPFLPTGPAR